MVPPPTTTTFLLVVMFASIDFYLVFKSYFLSNFCLILFCLLDMHPDAFCL
jgi:hypothetical protein